MKERRHGFYAQFNGFRDETPNKGASQVPISSALVEKDKNFLVQEKKKKRS